MTAYGLNISLTTTLYAQEATESDFVRPLFIVIVLSLIISLSIGGNVLVCIAVCTDRQLRKRSNSLYVSLAVADLLLSMVVMPVSIMTIEMVGWKLSHAFCKIYLSMDVMCCTCSILNILFIAIDRYEHIRHSLSYNNRMTRLTFAVMIVFIWTFSILISFIPFHLDWHMANDPPTTKDSSKQSTTVSSKTVSPANSEEEKKTCSLKLNPVYAIVSSTFSFFLPCFFLVILYILLYRFAREHAARMKSRSPQMRSLDSETRLNDTNVKPPVQSHRASTDHKAAVTLGVIMGTFLLCWTPFFIMNCIQSACGGCIPEAVFNTATWLGYLNSSLNPIIYSIFNRDFRNAFHKVLCRLCGVDRGDTYPFPRRTNNKASMLFTKPVKGHQRRSVNRHSLTIQSMMASPEMSNFHRESFSQDSSNLLLLAPVTNGNWAFNGNRKTSKE